MREQVQRESDRERVTVRELEGDRWVGLTEREIVTVRERGVSESEMG